jgi:hypothetical protein
MSNSYGSITIGALMRVRPRPTLTQLNDLAVERDMTPIYPDGPGNGHFNPRAHATILSLWRSENPEAASKPVDKDKRAGRGPNLSLTNRLQRERLARDAAGNRARPEDT